MFKKKPWKDWGPGVPTPRNEMSIVQENLFQDVFKISALDVATTCILDDSRKKALRFDPIAIIITEDHFANIFHSNHSV